MKESRTTGQLLKRRINLALWLYYEEEYNMIEISKILNWDKSQISRAINNWKGLSESIKVVDNSSK